MRHKTGLIPLIGLLSLLATAALASHSNVTLKVDSARKRSIQGSVEIINNVGEDQFGTLSIIVFEIKKNGRLKELGRTQQFGVQLAGGKGNKITVPFEVTPFRGRFVNKPNLVLADYHSTTGNILPPHTHSSTVTVE